MTHKKPITKLIAGVLSVVMVFGVLMLFSPTEAQAISLNATDTGFYNVSYNERDTIFGVGSQIRVENKLRTSKNSATYTLTEEGWKTTDAFVWNAASKNEFEAWYPFNASYTGFTIPTDQSSDQLLGAADWMIASSGKIDKPENHALNLYFTHQLSKVTVNIVEWNSEFDGSEKIIEDLKIYSKGTALTAAYDDSDVTITATDGETGITPLVSGASYTAIVAPAKYANTDKLLTFTVDGREMTVLATPSRLTNEGLQAGLHYLFDLRVGKDGVAIQSVNVAGWVDGGTIDGGVAKEVVRLNVVDATAMNADQLNAAVTKALEAGETDIEVTLKPDAPAEMITAIRRAICDTEGVADGSIHLTLRGVTSIPGTTNWDGVAFGACDTYDEDGKVVDQEYLTQLASVNLPDVTSIGDQAFYGCSNLTFIIAPNAQIIGRSGFDGTGITSIDMPLLKEVGYAAFFRSALTEVYLPSLEIVGNDAFRRCEQLQTVDLPKLQTLSKQLFQGCAKLESITLGSVVTEVNENLFGGEALSSGITLTLHPDQANAEGTLKATAGTNVEWAGFTWKEVKFSATE